MRKLLPTIPLIFFALTLSVAFARAAGDADSADQLSGPAIILPINQLHPTQFAVGGIEVAKRTKKYKETIKDKSAPFIPDGRNEMYVVLGPDGNYYIVNGHHHLKSLDEAGVKEAQVILVKDWSKREHPDDMRREMEEFWKKMEKHDFVYLKDQHGKDRRVDELPRHLKDMKDDPFRSIAWFVRKAGGFEKSEKPFAEFRWAEYFRQRITLKDPNDPEQFAKAVAQAIDESRKDAAAGLPGYKPFPKEKCDALFAQIADILPKK